MHYPKFLIVGLVFFAISSCTSSGPDLYPVDPAIKKQVEEIMQQMTLEEKAGQMVNMGLPAILIGNEYWGFRDTAIIDTAKLAKYIGKYGVGSIHNTPRYPPDQEEWYKIIKQIQDYAINDTRLGIPVIYGIDGIHGANYVNHSTMLPQQIALAATWNPEWAEEAGRITAYELRSASLPWNYAPVIDVAPQALWGRIFESFGEDPYLISQMAVSYIKGSQGGSISDTTKAAVCLKHFVGYGAGKNGKDRANATIPESYLRQYYLPPFEEAIKAGALTVMLSSNAVNSIPCHINKYYITDILKGELAFGGFTISDFSDVEFLQNAHRVAHTKKEATKMAVMAGLDMIMNPYDADVAQYIVELVKEGEIPISRVDDAVTRILRVKLELDLYSHPYNDYKNYTDFASEEMIESNYLMASEAITLLKNNDILPLNGNETILVTGPAANSENYLNGAWSRSFLGTDIRFNDPSKKTILDAIQEHAGKNKVVFAEGTDYENDINTDKAVSLAKNVDIIVACIGEIPSTEKPSDINELPLPSAQQEFVKRLAKTGKPVVLLLVEARPRIIKEIEPLSEAIVMAYLPGDEGGRAIADVLYGKINPSGKLPYTYPKFTGNALTYLHKEADIRDKSWGFEGFYPQFEFGHGLSYTSFDYHNLACLNDTIYPGDTLKVSVQVSNSGNMDGKEIVQLYIRDMVASVSPDVKKLIRFKKIELLAGESKTVEFKVVNKDLAFVGIDNKWITEPGDFEIMIGGNPANLLHKQFYLKSLD